MDVIQASDLHTVCYLCVYTSAIDLCPYAACRPATRMRDNPIGFSKELVIVPPLCSSEPS